MKTSHAQISTLAAIAAVALWAGRAPGQGFMPTPSYDVPATVSYAGGSATFSVRIGLGAPAYALPASVPNPGGPGTFLSTLDEDPFYAPQDNAWARRTFEINGGSFEFGFITRKERHESSRVFYQGSSPFPADLEVAGDAFDFDDFGFIVSPAGQMWILGGTDKDNQLSSLYETQYYARVPARDCRHRRIAGKCIAAWINDLADISLGAMDYGVVIGPVSNFTDVAYIPGPAEGSLLERQHLGLSVRDRVLDIGGVKCDVGHLANPAGLAPHGLARVLPASVQDPRPGTVFPAGSVLFFLSSKEEGLENNLAKIQSFIDQVDPGTSPLPVASLGIGAGGPGSGPQRVQGRSRLCFTFDPLAPAP